MMMGTNLYVKCPRCGFNYGILAYHDCPPKTLDELYKDNEDAGRADAETKPCHTPALSVSRRGH